MKTEEMAEELEKELESGLQPLFPGATATAHVDGEHKITSFGVFATYLVTTAPQVSPYLKFGLGSGKLKTSVDEFSGHLLYQDKRIPYEGSLELDDISKAYVDIGGGILYQLSENIVLTGEVLFSRLMTDGAQAENEIEENFSAMGQTWEGKEKIRGEYEYNTDYVSAFAGLTFFFGGKK